MAWNFSRKGDVAAVPDNDRSRPAVSSGIGAKEALGFCQSFEVLNVGGFWSTDADGTLTYISPRSAERLGGLAQPGTSITDIFSAVDGNGEGGRSLRFVLSRKSRFERLTVCSGEDGKKTWWQLSGEAINDREFAGFRGICTEITDDRRIAEENSRMAMHDPLTGLLNRRQMSRLIERTLTAYTQQNRPCATLLIDLDRFKQVNDTLGHSTGDALLKQVAERLTTVIGDAEKVCRLGGDEFQVLLPDVEDRGELGELAQRVISMLSQPYTVDGSRCIIGASVGVAISPFDGQDADELIRNADLALYAAKHGGRGGYRFFSRELLRNAEERRGLEDDLHDALARGELELHYQPVVHTQSNTVSGAEALVRWNHPEKGRISPALFIPIAEESQLIRHIGEWALRTACMQAVEWPAKLRVAVNVSPAQFADPGFPSVVANALAHSGLQPERLELEITEGVFLAEGAGTDATFKALKNLGVRLALDDFGTGYSSLGYLKSAPFDKIKIDQSFVRGATDPSSRNKAIITAIVALAEALDMETTAEGIETFDQLDLLRELGVSHIQGYIYAKPMEGPAFVEQACNVETWGIEPSGHAKQRHDRVSVFRRIGAIHQDHYYSVVLRNLSPTGALIEGLVDVPVGTQFVIYFGDGQLEVATVRRSMPEQQGLEFEKSLVDDGAGGLCTRTRASIYDLVSAGLPTDLEKHDPSVPIGSRNGKLTIPAFRSVIGQKSIVKTSASGR